MTTLAVVILTYNEERHIVRALDSIAAIATQIFVIDSFSTDRTVEIARARGATVLQHAFVNQARQLQWALEHASVTTDWVMRLDADEVVEPALAAEIAAKLPNLPPEITGINLRRRHIFLGRWIRHGGRYPLILLRLWRRGQARVEDRWMDEHMTLTNGRAVLFDAPFTDDNLGDLTAFPAKHNAYAAREAVDVLARRYGLAAAEAQHLASRQAAFKRAVKERVYNRLPFPIAALGYFLFRYICQFGFLDGREGLIYHGLQGFWYRFLVGAKLQEFDRVLRNLPTPEDRRAMLARLSGLPL
ncbi:MAG: glycosyl transferase [Rhizobiales bacterium 63-7]|nr:MAG: glycosyl transferase [Rhizobiales bacterium 63-7]